MPPTRASRSLEWGHGSRQVKFRSRSSFSRPHDRKYPLHGIASVPVLPQSPAPATLPHQNIRRKRIMARVVGRLLVDSLEAHDIGLIYCVPGESYLGFTNALVDNNRMRLIVCRHEGGAAFMAAADGRMRNGRA